MTDPNGQPIVVASPSLTNQIVVGVLTSMVASIIVLTVVHYARKPKSRRLKR